MPRNWSQFVDELKIVVDAYDRPAAEDMCRELVSTIKATGELPLPAEATERVLKMLRNRRMFAQMEQVGDASISAGEKAYSVRTEYVQALIDKGDLRGAGNELRALLADLSLVADKKLVAVKGKVHGLFGRLYKQQYIALTVADTARKRAVLEQSMASYREAANLQPTELWYTINLVALSARAARDNLGSPELHKEKELARELLDRIDRDIQNLPVWDLATFFEASVALDDADEALKWLCEYLRRPDATAFEVSSTYRQMIEVWQLTTKSGLGERVLPVLQHAVASRPGGNIELVPSDIRRALTPNGTLTNQAVQSFEKAFGPDKAKSLRWFTAMLQRARLVGQVATITERETGVGTGFLVRASDFFKVPGAWFSEDEWLLLTNSHVVGRADYKALPPEVACVNFEVLDIPAIAFSELVWESGSAELDATFLRMKNFPAVGTTLEPYPMIADAPVHQDNAHRRVFVIGHAASGPLSVSLQDSLQVGWREPYVHYRTPTDKGSSGSPVFDEYWRLVALHHSALETVRSADGTSSYGANEGIWIQSIRDKTMALD